MGPTVHLTLTRAWCLEEGYPQDEAEAIAEADYSFDARFPARASLANITRHFAPTAWLWSRRYLTLACRFRDLERLGYAIHCAQDAVSHGTLGEGHLLAYAGLRREPDSWDAAPRGVRTRIERVTRSRLRRYRSGTC
ncbi:hypothetical protein [Anaerosoma tenue]|uniref:hypothetical protein n=1 Tax=Anaerosoma tenue TaxID=2933588 RepID=UPI002260D8D6|nr:hypothetical protein [Anaerosoma tenue]MCK8114631.1 hypothetical protein [Anaerosoma tenue]